MHPAADHPQPQKRRRFENGHANASTTRNQPFLNGTIALPRHAMSAHQRSNPSFYTNPVIHRQSLNGQIQHQASFAQSNGVNTSPHPQQTPSFQSSPQNGELGLAAPGTMHSTPFPHTTTQHRQPNTQTIHVPFGNASTPLQTASTMSRQQPWPSHQQPSTAADFAGSNALDGFFTSEGNASVKPTATSHHRMTQNSLNAPSLPDDSNYPAVLPPMPPGAPPSLGTLDPFSNFPPLESAFSNTTPLHVPFLSSNPLANISSSSSPALTSASYPLQVSSTVPTPPMRQRIGPRTTNGLSTAHPHNVDTPQVSMPQSETSSVLPRKRGITLAESNASGPRGSLSLGMIPPVKRALDLFRDGSPIIVALARTIMQANINVSGTVQRSRILSFTGFPRNLDPKFLWLLSLSKNDLDILAWVFVVSKHGRKEEVARRIVSSLRAPLKFRIPPEAKKPGIPTRADARNASLGTLAAAIRNAPQTSRTSSTRSNMPSLAPAPVLNPRGERILNNLQTQLGSSNARGTTSLSSAPSHRGSGQRNRSKQVENLCSEVLQGYSFDVGENPFNKPMNAPLGSEPYVVFSSMQLSRGNNDPALRFQTPAPIQKRDRPEVGGGDLQIHIRCLRVEIEKPKAEWKQAWPFPATCRVNGHSVTLNQAQRYTNGKLAGRDAATNITPFLRKYKRAGMNDINKVVLRRQASTATAAAGQYVFFAQEILVLSHETMTKSVFEASDKYWVDYRANLERRGSISRSTSKFEMARQGVMQFLTDPDGVTVSSMKVSLRCPLALTRIATPVKGRKCQHVQCFDLENFLEYARRSSKFDCPVCNKNTAYPAMLVISPYIEHALATFKDCDEVEINQDGSMVEVERKQTGVASDDDDDADIKPEPRKVTSRHSGTGVIGVGGAPEVVDLTLDSDDEEGPEGGEAQQIGSIPAEMDVSLPPISDIHIAQASPGAQGSHGGSSSPLEQDMFSFRADFCWRDPQITNNLGSAPARIQQAQVDSGGDNWASDVIAIDSD